VPDLFCTPGARGDVTLEAFSWLLVQTGDGPDFECTNAVDPARFRSLVLEAEQRRRRYLERRPGAEGADQIERSDRELYGKDTEAGDATSAESLTATRNNHVCAPAIRRALESQRAPNGGSLRQVRPGRLADGEGRGLGA